MEILAVIAAVGVIIAGVIYQQMQLAKKRRWNYQWYAGEFPNLVRNGRVACYRCQSTNLGVERLMHQTYLRAHICRQCGTTLYYSSEN